MFGGGGHFGPEAQNLHETVRKFFVNRLLRTIKIMEELKVHTTIYHTHLYILMRGCLLSSSLISPNLEKAACISSIVTSYGSPATYTLVLFLSSNHSLGGGAG